MNFRHPLLALLATALWSCSATPPQTQPQPTVPRDGTDASGIIRDCADCPQLIAVPGGTYRMGDLNQFGDADERPVHAVSVPAFLMARFETTFDQWDACAADGACNSHLKDEGWGRGRRPVVNVEWKEAQAYVRWLGAKTGKHYRLPSEAEWEYAARAGTTTLYPWGSEMEPGVAVCYSECGAQADLTAPVGSARPNPFGLHDMLGNVWEYVQDCWHSSYEGAPSDGSAWETPGCSERVMRGGGWLSLGLDMRSAVRSELPDDIRYKTVGFRVARDP